MSPVWAIWTRSQVDALGLEDLDLPRAGVAGRARVGHDRRPGPNARPRGRAVDLLDVLGDPGLVGGALDEPRLDLGPLDPALDVGDEEVGDLVGVAAGQEARQVVVGVDAGAGDHLEPGLLGDPAHEVDVAAEEHRGRVADRLHPEPDRRLRRLDRRLVLAARPELALGDASEGGRLRPLQVDRLVARDEVLVDQRRPELARVDRARDGLDRCHRGAVYAASARSA